MMAGIHATTRQRRGHPRGFYHRLRFTAPGDALGDPIALGIGDPRGGAPFQRHLIASDFARHFELLRGPASRGPKTKNKAASRYKAYTLSEAARAQRAEAAARTSKRKAEASRANGKLGGVPVSERRCSCGRSLAITNRSGRCRACQRGEKLRNCP